MDTSAQSDDRAPPPLPARGIAAYVPATQLQWLSSSPGERWRELDGSLVMADVSGFTKLAERLARQGKVGAEELTDVLNNVFRRLLEASSALGGDCLKFGGDALFLLFTGPGHASRACVAARSMGELVRATRHSAGSGRPVRLDMSLGVHSGECHLFIAGRSHAELIAAGPAVSRTLEMESAADAGEVLLSEDTAALVPRECLGERKAGGWLLARPPAAPLTPPPAPIGDGFDASSCVPVALRDQLGGEANEGEHRLATVAFVPFAGTDGLLASAGPEATAEALDELICHAQQACERHGVSFLATDVNRDGGKIILAAGMPSAVVEGEERMLHALRELVAAPTRFQVRAGVNHGRIFSVDLGGAHRRTYTVIGDAVNLAARVAFKGATGQVVATDEVLTRVRSRFSLTPLEPFFVKGKALPVSAMVVGPVEEAATDEIVDLEPLVGREIELAALRDAVSAAEGGRGGVTFIVGEPGIGKSRLIAEVVTLRHDLPWVRVEGGQYALAIPYFALKAPLQSLLGVAAGATPAEVAAQLRDRVLQVSPQLEPWIPLLGVALGLELADSAESKAVDQQFRRTKLHAVVIEFLGRVLPDPLLLTIEDAHWLDAGSADVLAGLLEDVGRRGWAVLISSRDVAEGLVPAGIEGASTMPLAGIDDRAAARFVATATEDAPLAARVTQSLVERADGNPLFLRELVIAARSSATMDELPATVEDIVAASVDTLPPDDRMALRSAAVLGTRFRVAELEQLARTQVLAFAAALDDAMAARRRAVDPVILRLGQFLVGEGPDRLRFRNVLLRDVAYEGLPYRTRRRLHGQAGEFIERLAGDRPDDAAELLALHFHNAGNHDKAWRYSRTAGQRAQHNGALVEAAVFYQWALEASAAMRAVPKSERAEVYEQLGDVCEVSARYPEATAAYRRARRLRGSDPLSLAWLCKKEGWVRERSDRYSEALRWYTKGFRYLATVDALPDRSEVSGVNEIARCRSELTLSQGAVRLRQGRYRAAIPLLEAAAADAEALGQLSTLAHAYTWLYWAHSDLGTEQRHRYRTLALPIFEELGDHHGQAKALNNEGCFLYYEGRWEEAIDFLERSAVAHGRAGDVVAEAMTGNNVAEIWRDRGNLKEAEELFKTCLHVVRAAENPLAVGYVLANLGLCAARAGRLDEAAAELAVARSRLQAIGADEVVLETDTKECERLVLAGAAEAAVALIQATLNVVARLGGIPSLSIPLHRIHGYALAQQRRYQDAWAELDLSLAEGRVADAQFEVALTLQAMAIISRLWPASPATGEMAAEAAALFERLGVVETPEVPLPEPPG